MGRRSIGKAGKMIPVVFAALLAVIVFAALPANDSIEDTVLGTPGDYHTGDIGVINNIIATNGLNWTPGPTDGDFAPSDWTGVTWSTTASKRITALNISGKELYGTLDVTGLSSMRNLNCSNNELTGLTLTGLTLTNLNCSQNELTSLDLSGVTTSPFITLNCSSNYLTALNITGKTLASLNCSDNSIGTLDLTGQTLIANLDCSRNQLTSLNVAGITSLTGLKCSNNGIGSLTLTGLTNLIELNCSNNSIVTLNTSPCTNLTYLYCNDNKLTQLTVTSTKLDTLICSYNDLPDLNLSACVATLDLIDCVYNRMESLASITGGGSIPWNVPGSISNLNYMFYPQIINISDVGLAAPVAGAAYVPINTSQYTATVTWSPALVSGTTFGYDIAYSATIRIIPKAGYFTMDGVESEFFTVTDGTIVQWYDTDWFRVTFDATNKFPTVAVGAQNGTMRALFADQVTFQVTTTDIPAGTYSVTVNGIPAGVSVLGNQVTINGAGAGTLTLVGSASALTGTYTLKLNISVATSGNFTLTITGDPIFTVDDITVINDMIQNNGLGWTPAPSDGSSVPLDWTGVVVWDKNTGLNRRIVGLTLESEGLYGDVSLSKLASLKQLLCVGNDNLSSLDVSGITTLLSLDCAGNGLESLDVTGCAALTEIDCSSNMLTSLDLSGCAALQTLYCEKNEIGELDVSGMTSLKYMYCWFNALTSVDVSGCTALEELICYGNSLTSLDVTGLTNLKILDCSSNAIEQLDVFGSVSMEILSCEKNRITDLNVAGLANLSELYCFENRLAALNLSGCTSLDYLDCSYNMFTALNVTGCPLAVKMICYDNYMPGESSVTGFTAWDDANFKFNPQKTTLTFVHVASFDGLLDLRLEVGIEIDLSEGVDGGSYPYSFAIAAGALPPGLSLSPDGIISGTPTALNHPAGTVTIRVTDDRLPNADTRTLTLSYGISKAPPLKFTNNSGYNIPQSSVGVPIASKNVTGGVTGGEKPYTFSATGLPAGISINPSTGVISGTPTASVGNGTATITVTDASGDSKSITITYGAIAPPPVAFANSLAFNIPESTTGVPITPIDVSSGAYSGTPPYRFTAQYLPPGLTISTNGVISGTPTGSYPAGTAFIYVHDQYSTAYIVISFGEVGGPLAYFHSPLFNIPASTAGNAITSINVSTGAAGGAKPYTFTASGLPAGLTINRNSGIISGTPTTPGPAGTATITVTDSDGTSKSITISYGAIAERSTTGGNEGGGGDSMMLIAVVAVAVVGVGAAAAYFLFLRPKP